MLKAHQTFAFQKLWPSPRRDGASVQVYPGRRGSLQRRPRLAAAICGEQAAGTRWTSATDWMQCDQETAGAFGADKGL